MLAFAVEFTTLASRPTLRVDGPFVWWKGKIESNSADFGEIRHQPYAPGAPTGFTDGNEPFGSDINDDTGHQQSTWLSEGHERGAKKYESKEIKRKLLFLKGHGTGLVVYHLHYTTLPSAIPNQQHHRS